MTRVWTTGLDFRGQVIHETGHALGFQHEDDRADNPRDTGCIVADANTVYDGSPTYGTQFDLQSIMNYSYDQGPAYCQLPRPYRLSKWDIVGAQNAYGRRSPGQLVAESGGCLDVPQPYGWDEELQMYECAAPSANQRWYLWASGPLYGRIYNEQSIASAEVHPTWGANHPVAIGPGNGAMNVYWRAVGYQIKGIGDTCLDVPAGQIFAGQAVQIYECNGGNNQLWKAYYDDNTIRPVGDTNFCLDVPWGSATWGNALQLYPCHGGAAQKFTFEDSGEIRFQNLCLDVRYGTPDNHNPVQLYGCKSAGDLSRVNQLWHLTTTMRSWNDESWCLGAENNSSLSHTRVIQSTCNGSAGQQWDYYFASLHHSACSASLGSETVHRRPRRALRRTERMTPSASITRGARWPGPPPAARQLHPSSPAPGSLPSGYCH